MDQYTEVTTTGLGSRLMEAIKGVAVGLLLFIAAFPLLWWNEGNAVKTLRSLREGARAVVGVSIDSVNPANDGKLVYVAGEATTGETVRDPQFGVSARAIKLLRKVEMYQWREKTSSRKEKKLGGSETTTTTYSYDPAWSEAAIDSAAFKHPQGHENPPMPFLSEQFAAGDVQLGAFHLNPSQIGRMTGAVPADASQASLPESLPGQAPPHPIENGLQVGDPASPKVGDLRITFTQVPPQAVSIIVRQVKDTFEPYPTKQDRPIDLLTMGTSSADSMFAAAKTQASILTWILRAVGLLAMFFGLMLVLRPIATLGDVVPFFGSMLRFGAGLISGTIALCFSLVTIAIAWIAYRPLVGIALLALACLAGYGVARLRRSKTPKAMAASAS